MSPCERQALLTAERLLLAARECVCTAYSVIENDLDMAHPALVAIEASEEVIGEAQVAIESEQRRGAMAEIVPLRPADPGTDEHHRKADPGGDRHQPENVRGNTEAP